MAKDLTRKELNKLVKFHNKKAAKYKKKVDKLDKDSKQIGFVKY